MYYLDYLNGDFFIKINLFYKFDMNLNLYAILKFHPLGLINYSKKYKFDKPILNHFETSKLCCDLIEGLAKEIINLLAPCELSNLKIYSSDDIPINNLDIRNLLWGDIQESWCYLNDFKLSPLN